MKDKNQFYREQDARDGLSVDCVIPIIQSFDGDLDALFIDAVSKQDTLSSEYRYLLVLPLSDKSLFDMIAHDSLCGNIDKIRFIMIDICDCLSSIHSKQRMHGDIKPLNIMVEGSGRAWLTDFGMARPALQIDRETYQ